MVPEPAKRPRSSNIRFAAELPNECWQADFTHYPLAGGNGTEVLTWLDDHSRYVLSMTAHHRVTGPAVVAAFRAAVGSHGAPVRAENPVHGSEQQSCAARRPAVVITDHVAAVRLRPDHAGGLMAAAVAA